MPRINIDLTRELYERFAAQCRKEGYKHSGIVRVLIARWLEERARADQGG